jgi:hypothetical protein
VWRRCPRTRWRSPGRQPCPSKEKARCCTKRQAQSNQGLASQTFLGIGKSSDHITTERNKWEKKKIKPL